MATQSHMDLNKLKHKLTFDYPDQLGIQANRSSKKNRTMIRSFYGNKQNSPYDVQIYTSKDQKYIKSLVQTKIQQLHSKMKNFFCSQRKQHLQNIAPQMSQLKQSIQELKQQISRPKSFEEIQEEKYNLLKRKVLLLKEIQEMNKKVKTNKDNFCQIKFQCQELDRELMNGYATIQKYKRKLEKLETEEKQIDVQPTNIKQEIQQKNCQKYENLQKILNDSLCDQPIKQIQNLEKQSININKQKNFTQLKDHASDRVHVTEIYSPYNLPLLQSQDSRKLPCIQNKKKVSNKGRHYNTPNLLQKTNFIKRSIINNSSTSFDRTSNSMVVVSQQQKKSQMIKNDKKNQQSLRNFTVQSNYGVQYQLQVQKAHQLTKRKNYEFDLSITMKKYEKLIQNKKWHKINQLFQEIQSMPLPYQSQSRYSQDKLNSNQLRKSQVSSLSANNSNSIQLKQYSTNPTNLKNNKISISLLQQNLMQQLRKRQFSLFKEKGYHEGLKDKTYQIRFQLKKLFKNYSTDEFFDEIMKKKAIKKQLMMILQSLLN